MPYLKLSAGAFALAGAVVFFGSESKILQAVGVLVLVLSLVIEVVLILRSGLMWWLSTID